MKPDLLTTLSILGATWFAWTVSRVVKAGADAWQKWKDAVAALPGIRRAAFDGMWRAVKYSVALAVVLIGLSYLSGMR